MCDLHGRSGWLPPTPGHPWVNKAGLPYYTIFNKGAINIIPGICFSQAGDFYLVVYFIGTIQFLILNKEYRPLIFINRKYGSDMLILIMNGKLTVKCDCLELKHSGK
jgi:hypothetical protein